MERIALPPRSPRELPLALLELGCAGTFELVVGPPGGARGPPHRATLPLGVPPFAPSLVSELEQKLLGSPEWLPPHQHERAQRSWSRHPEPRNLFALEPTPPMGGLRAQRDPKSGSLKGFVEELLPNVGLSAKNSLSLRRPPGPPQENLWGSATSCPFWPAGLDEPSLEQLRIHGDEEEDVDFDTDLLVTPPGLKRGVEYKASVGGHGGGGPLSLCSLLQTLDPFDLGGDEDIEGGGPPKPEVGGRDGDPPKSPPPLPHSDSVDELLHQEVVEPAPAPPPAPPEDQWAVAVDTSEPMEDFESLVPDPAFKWPFKPDPFQLRAVLCLEQGHSLLAAAHTSAGKTAIAEYAIALAQRHMARSIYTSPIKALSNQKFRDFRGTFGSVGLLTGDVQLHPEASCLVMTTEILRSMLYNGSDVIRDLEWVIFDEVHYINDAERGVVWEEVLIMLPEHVKLVLLSATIPNAMEFAQWVGRTKRRCLRVLSTQRRPVPLQHFLYTGNGPRTREQLFLLLDAHGSLSTQGYYAAVEAKKQQQSSKAGQSFGAKHPTMAPTTPGQERGLWQALLGLLRERGLLPVVAFTFSRSRCDAHAAALGPTELLSPSERQRSRLFLQRCLARLKAPDRRLPQVVAIGELLQRGIGVHHGGVLPLLKEVVEMLFSQGLVKVLFATETFAMGLNMPARTVVFDSIRKHDGNNFRDLLPGEYIQMSGRAGRRGLDAMGTVIILCRGSVPDLPDLHRMMLGRPTRLQSQFRLTYPMILNVLRAQELRVQDLLRRSYAEFPLRREQEAQARRVAELQGALSAEPEPDPGSDVSSYHEAVEALRRDRKELMRRLADSVAGLRVLVPGRVLVVSTQRHRNALGLILQVTPSPSGRIFTTLVLAEKPPEGGEEPPTPPDAPLPEELLLTRLFLPDGPCGHALEQLQAQDFVGVTAKTLKVNPENLLQELRPRHQHRDRPALGAALQELLRLAAGVGGGSPLPLLDPAGILRDPDALEAAARVRELSARLGAFECVHRARFQQEYAQAARRRCLQEQLEQLRFQLSDSSLLLLPEYRQRLEVLRSLGHVTPSGAVALGGRVAASLSTGSLLVTELLLSNGLAALSPAESASLLSCVATGGGGGGRGEVPPLSQALGKAVQHLVGLAQRLGRLQQECGLSTSAEDVEQELNFSFMEVVFEWAHGVPFASIRLPPALQEGSVVRCIQRLEELCRELRQAARLLGEPALATKMEAVSGLIRRDIVFAASLYTQ
ncbi:superkiller complex protein 2 [Neopsephotus bourkii]|uniref:superkiller complex protein 2 n=1 Tax=Neopsephotus bourkii TaxID=309878 RepID=UPI002AA5C1C0|nr:superkiller complex protein 2 [Neopsephotus bourkii]